MSGGHYDYAHSIIRQLADDVWHDIDTNDKEDEFGYSHHVPLDLLTKIQYAQRFLAVAAEIAHDLEWFYSGDTGADDLDGDLAKHFRNIVAALNCIVEEDHAKAKRKVRNRRLDVQHAKSGR